MLEAAGLTPGQLSLQRQKAALWVAFAIILIVSALALFSMQRMMALGSRIEQRQDIMLETSHYLSEIKDVETGGRGYFLTGDIHYLQLLHAGTANAKATAGRLKELSDNASLSRQLDGLFALAEKRIELAEKRAQARSSIAAVPNIRDGSQLMEQVKVAGQAIIASQSASYREERQRLEWQGLLTSLALALGVILCSAGISWLFALRGRELERRRRLEEELRGLNLDLEDRVQQRTGEVKRARDFLDTIVENLPDMIFVKDAADDYRYVLVNAAGETLLGRDREEIIGATDLELLPREEADQFRMDSRQALDSGRLQIFPDRQLSGPFGTRTVESRKIPIHNGSPVSHLVLGIIRDVTQPRAVEDQLRQLQRMDAIGRLTGGVAHDFNNLLAIIHGNSELVRGQLEDGSEAAEMTDDVVGAAARGAELVRRLLAFARMQHLEPEPLDLNARLPNIVGLLQRSLGENIKVQIKLAKKLWPASVDPTQVDDALVNLAINSRDAMPGGGSLTIETQNITLDEEYAANHVEVTPGDYVMIAVSDTGTGMTPDVIARAFDPFFTTKEEGKGTGLGLSQVFGWIKQSGGHIKIYSELGHGTTVKLYLPRAKTAGDEKPAEPELATPKGDETIFVVEDNPNVRKTVIRQLHDLGYQTIEAESGAEAVRLIREGAKFDLLLTDVVMPGGVTGYELADELRRTMPALRVLFTSGYTELAAASGSAARNDALLSKPYRKQDLGRAVRLALDTPLDTGAAK